MCERYSFSLSKEKIARRYHVKLPLVSEPRFNIYPVQVAPVITNTQPQQLSLFIWGLPSQKKNGLKISSILHPSLPASSIIISSHHKNLLCSQRCLILTDGFYVWKKTSKKGKVPFRVVLQWNVPFAFAGIWQEGLNENNEPVSSFAIITTEANSTINFASSTMPVILSLEDEQIWLDNSRKIEDLTSLLVPFPAERMKIFPVSSLLTTSTDNLPVFIQPAIPTDQFGNYVMFYDQ